MKILHLLPLALFACGTPDYDIYVVGVEGSYSRPFLWHDGQKTELVQESGDFHARANDVFVDGGEVYVAGTPGQGRGAGYWKNGELVSLCPSGGGAEVIEIVGGDIYVAGACDSKPVYWKNDSMTELQVDAEMFEVTGMTVVGDTVYVSGLWSNMSSPHQMPCFWQNGTRTDLSDSAGNLDFDTSGIVVVDGSIHVAGSYFDTSNGGDQVACFWKDGTRQDLDGRSTSGIAVSDGTVYFSGTDGDPCFWEETDKTELEVNGSGHGSDLVVVDGDVIMVGKYGYQGDDDYLCYWVGEERYELWSERVVGLTGVFAREK